MAVIAIVAILMGILLPGVQAVREMSRKVHCTNHLRQLALGLHSYQSAYKILPPPVWFRGELVELSPCGGPGAYKAANIWFEASSGRGQLGTSWVVSLLPFIERATIFQDWDFQTSVSENRDAAAIDISQLYCPSRRSGVVNASLMFGGWNAGGNDYGGCIGAVNGYHNCGAREFWQDKEGNRTLADARGVFCRVNQGTRFSEISDGLSQTALLGELQRLDDGTLEGTSSDGWAIGGDSTHFSLCADHCPEPNSDHFEAPGSDHPGGFHLARADASVAFVSDSVDKAILSALGGMAEGSPVNVDF